MRNKRYVREEDSMIGLQMVEQKVSWRALKRYASRLSARPVVHGLKPQAIGRLREVIDMYFHEYMQKAQEAQSSLDSIPTAELQTIQMEGKTNPKQIKAVVVNDRIVATVSRHYRLVQHKVAFQPILDGLHATATDYDFALIVNDARAWFKVFCDTIPENGNGIRLGFEATNSLNGKSAIHYLFRTESVTKVVEIVGYRQICSNGMKIRVPLDQAEFVRPEVREKVEALLVLSQRIIHMGNPEERISAVQFVVEALSLLREPVALIIQKAKDKQVGEQEAKRLIGKYVGKRLSSRILHQFAEEQPTMWGLYNSITYVASHDVKLSTMNGLIDSSAEMLEQELAVKVKK